MNVAAHCFQKFSCDRAIIWDADERPIHSNDGVEFVEGLVYGALLTLESRHK